MDKTSKGLIFGAFLCIIIALAIIWFFYSVAKHFVKDEAVAIGIGIVSLVLVFWLWGKSLDDQERPNHL